MVLLPGTVTDEELDALVQRVTEAAQALIAGDIRGYTAREPLPAKPSTRLAKTAEQERTIASSASRSECSVPGAAVAHDHEDGRRHRGM